MLIGPIWLLGYRHRNTQLNKNTNYKLRPHTVQFEKTENLYNVRISAS